MGKLAELAERLEAHGARLARNADCGGTISLSVIAGAANCFAVAAALRARTQNTPE